MIEDDLAVVRAAGEFYESLRCKNMLGALVLKPWASMSNAERMPYVNSLVGSLVALGVLSSSDQDVHVAAGSC